MKARACQTSARLGGQLARSQVHASLTPDFLIIYYLHVRPRGAICSVAGAGAAGTTKLIASLSASVPEAWQHCGCY
jgi:hypothetical protein